MAGKSSDHRFPSVISVERAAQTLRLLGENGASAVTDLARDIGVSASAIHRILTALSREGFVEQDPASERYSLSWTVLKLARSLLMRADVREMALPYMRELATKTKETAALSVRVRFERVLIEQIVPEQEVHWWAPIGSVSPLYAGASGKVFLAHVTDAERDRYFAEVELHPLTPHTATDRSALEPLLVRIRRDGYAIGHRDRMSDVAGASVPIFESDGSVRFALSIAGPAQRCPVNKLRKIAETLLVPVAQEISLLHGYEPVSRTAEGV